MIEEYQWEALQAIFDEFNLDSYNSRAEVNAGGYFKRRAWFYTGAGMPLNDDGSLNTHGYMSNRAIGPVHGRAYYNHLLINWVNRDERFRCLFVDASIGFYGQFVQALNDPYINTNLTLVGEAIPTDIAGRKGAPWFSLVRFNRAPWWNLDDDGIPDVARGYNLNWSTNPTTMPTYFGVISNGQYSILNPSPPPSPGLGNDLTLAQIYSWIVKGATPVAWNGGYKKVGDAWNMATGRVMPSRQDRSMRVIRGARV